MPTSTNPYAGISSKRLVDLINFSNNKQLVEGVDFRFGNPRVVQGAMGYNTRTRLHRLTSEYPADIDVEYTRRPLSDLADLPSGMVVRALMDSPTFRVHDVLDRINAALGLDLQPHEVVNENFTAEQASYPITITENSLAWEPGSVFQLLIKSEDLNEIVTVKTLDGLYPPYELGQ